MARAASHAAIRLRGVRQNNLKNLDLDLPLHRLIVITGRSGSGKSSLAFDTLFAEGQRRYIETFSPYARQFFDRMDKPRVDSIEGIPPAIAIEQTNTVRTTRSTVGTMTELCDHLKVLWPWLARLDCHQCGQPVSRENPQRIWEATSTGRAGGDRLITFDLALPEKMSLAEALELVERQGYRRLLNDGRIVRLEDCRETLGADRIARLTVVQDRLGVTAAKRARFLEACTQAYHFGKGRLRVWDLDDSGQQPAGEGRAFSRDLHCAACDLDYREPGPALFSFNHPLGACPDCRGFGRVIEIDYQLAVPDRSLTLGGGAVKPWQGGVSAECQQDLLKFCRLRRVPVDVPFHRLSAAHQAWVIDGDPGYGTDPDHEWPKAWYGVKGYFRWLESKAYKMHVRVLLSRYRTYRPCTACGGRRFQPEALWYRLPVDALDWPGATARAGGLTLADFYALPIREAFALTAALQARTAAGAGNPLSIVLGEAVARLGYLVEAGLGYLTLDRPTRTLSGGETERVNLTTCLGTRLVNTLFVLDEPTVGLHPRDTERLVSIVERLRRAGNTVVVVEHEAAVMRAAEHIIDLGPGHGETGGNIVFQGAYGELLKSPASLTGAFLSGRRRIDVPARRPVVLDSGPNRARTSKARSQRDPLVLADATSAEVYRTKAPRRRPTLASLIEHGQVRRGSELRGAGPEAPVDRTRVSPVCETLVLAAAKRHNLQDLTVAIPLNRFVCVTGVSGSGKSTLVREVLHPALDARLRLAGHAGPEGAADATGEEGDEREALSDPLGELHGWECLARVLMVDQSSLGRTPRSNPAVYVGAFDHVRELFARSEEARQQGLPASAFSFNSAQGQCERCRGAGFEKIEMQFLSDVFIRCPDCEGRRYRPHILEVKLTPPRDGQAPPTAEPPGTRATWSIADLLEATVEDGLAWLGAFPESRARRAVEALQRLQDVGLGYLRLGQPINTLSGGESQRLKLAAHLAEAGLGTRAVTAPASPAPAPRPTLFLFDEPTTGLHFEDVRVLVDVFQRVVDAGHSVIVIEHNLELLKCADWIIDLGPEAGADGGRLVVAGSPEAVAACPASHTGKALREAGIIPG
ncbi:MAG: excinuclease ABC subunit UvrA [Verrucomicrobiales bacterium]|nr:excinuclease ABC subunit UvrA [Verrucomicrobiales bacterium]MCP5525788.1 excinuclease ABC subunit UvrA [Verrucomicrobiales bacterium]